MCGFDDYGDVPELDFGEDRYPDSVPVFDRGKQRQMDPDYTVPEYQETNDSSLRTCPVCTKMFSLKDIEVGFLDEFGDAVFFCCDEHKEAYVRTPNGKRSNLIYGKHMHNRTSTRKTDVDF